MKTLILTLLTIALVTCSHEVVQSEKIVTITNKHIFMLHPPINYFQAGPAVPCYVIYVNDTNNRGYDVPKQLYDVAQVGDLISIKELK